MILNQKEDFKFETRSRRPPLDPINAILSYMYSILSNEVASALESVGLDAYAGFMHTDRPGRISLALDFIYEDNGAILIEDDSRKKIIGLWQERKQKTLTHPFLNEKIEWGLVPFTQAMLLARYLRDDLDGYPAFMWK
jgi:CRISPR-associated protein Cas1